MASTITDNEPTVVHIEGAIFAAPLYFGIVVEAVVPF